MVKGKKKIEVNGKTVFVDRDAPDAGQSMKGLGVAIPKTAPSTAQPQASSSAQPATGPKKIARKRGVGVRARKPSAGLMAQEMARIGNKNRGPRDHPITEQEEKLHNQLRKRRASIIAGRKAARSGGGGGSSPAPKPKPAANAAAQAKQGPKASGTTTGTSAKYSVAHEKEKLRRAKLKNRGK